MERISASSTAFSVGKAGAATVVIMIFRVKAARGGAVLCNSNTINQRAHSCMSVRSRLIIAASARGLREFVPIFYEVGRILSRIAAIRYVFATTSMIGLTRLMFTIDA
jgi:hypothetical protein